MSNVAVFIVESYQGSFVPVAAHVVRIDEIEDCSLQPAAFSMPFVLLDQAQDFIRSLAAAPALIYDKPVKMNPIGIRWLSEVEAVQ